MSVPSIEMFMVMATIGVVIFLFVVEWVRVDVVAILMMVSLPLMGLVSPKEAFVGLSSNAVVSIIAVIIIGAGLDKTGVINKLVAPILRVAGKHPSRIVTAISLTVAGISSFMQNIGAAALFLPAIQRISRDLKIPISKLLMPIGFSAILGGTVTLVGSSPLIILNDLLIPYSLEPFGLFDVTPIGLALVAGGILSFVLLGRFILPTGASRHLPERPENTPSTVPPEAIERAFELRTPKDFTHYREPVTVSDLRRRYLASVVAMTDPPHTNIVCPCADVTVRSDIDIAVFGTERDVKRMAENEGMTLKEGLEVFRRDIDTDLAGTVEAVVAPRSPLVGKSLGAVRFEDRYRVVPVGISRHRKVYRAELAELPLMVGDTVILHGLWSRLNILKEEGALLFNLPGHVEMLRPEKAVFALAWLVVALVMIMGFKVQLSISLMTGALGMILTRVLNIDEAYHAVDWRTVFLLAGLIPLGIATEKSGTAAWIAEAVLGAIGQVSPVVLLTVIGLLSTFFTLVISNVGATVLLVPLVVNMAIAADLDPRLAALVVGLGTSNSFILPTHQVNALYMGPGRYRSTDFMKAGLVVSIVFIVVMITMISLVFGL